jgi:prephenate dehydratase
VFGFSEDLCAFKVGDIFESCPIRVQLQFFGESVEMKLFESFADVLESVRTREVKHGIVSIENSTKGIVNRTTTTSQNIVFEARIKQV